MPLIKCPECGRAVSDTARECPSCASPLQTSITDQPESLPTRPPWKQWARISIPTILLGLGLVITSLTIPIRQSPLMPQFSNSQREAAQGFWDTVVDQYVKVGLIARYELKDGMFLMYVRSPQWRLLSLEDKKTFMANLSKANEILGWPSYVEIRDDESGKVYAVTPSADRNEIYE